MLNQHLVDLRSTANELHLTDIWEKYLGESSQPQLNTCSSRACAEQLPRLTAFKARKHTLMNSKAQKSCSMFSDHNGTELESHKREEAGKDSKYLKINQHAFKQHLSQGSSPKQFDSEAEPSSNLSSLLLPGWPWMNEISWSLFYFFS